MSDFRTIMGVVQFPPSEGKAAGKDVVNIRVRQTGWFDREAKSVSVTIWPELQSVKVAEGDVVVVEGKVSETQGQNKQGDDITYFNLSAVAIAVVGKVTKAEKSESKSSQGTSDEDIPF